jgi:hypothetical protein
MAFASQPAYRPLPIDADEGFPQRFRLALGGRIYRLTLYASVSEGRLAATAPDAVLTLEDDDAAMVMRVQRESGVPVPATIFLRRLATGLDYEARELRFRFDELRVAVANLNGVGAFGSSVKGGVALAWGSSSGTP